MTTPATSLDDLHHALDSSDPIAVLGAAWEAFDFGQSVADAVAWREGFDELLALVTAQVCTAGQALLQHTHRALTVLSRTAGAPGP